MYSFGGGVTFKYLTDNFGSLTLRYNPYPDSNYDIITNNLNNKIYVEKNDGIKYELTKEKYIQLMKDFEYETGLYPIDHLLILN